MKEDIQIEEYYKDKKEEGKIISFCLDQGFTDTEIETVLKYRAAVEQAEIRAENLEKINAIQKGGRP